MRVDCSDAVACAGEDSYPDAVWLAEKLSEEVAVAVECDPGSVRG